MNYFVIVCNMSQKVFKDCLDKNMIIRTVKDLFGFVASLRVGLGPLCGLFLWALYMPQFALRFEGFIT